MCDCATQDCHQKFPSQKRKFTLSPEWLNAAGSTLKAFLPFCVNECNSNCDLTWDDFHFVALCVTARCGPSCYTALNDPECNGGELTDDDSLVHSVTGDDKNPFLIRQLPGVRVTLSRVGIELERSASGVWDDLLAKFGTGDESPTFTRPLTLCIEYWVNCDNSCCTDVEVVPVIA